MKPKSTRVNQRGETVVNPNATAGDAALMRPGLARMHFAIETELADIEDGGTTRMRYSRVRAAIIARFNCHRAEAERAIARARIHLAEKFADELPTMRADACRQLQRIADREEEADPLAAIAALREKAKILGLHAPKKIEVTQGDREVEDLRQVIDCLDADGRAALDVVLAQIEAAKATGRLALPAADGDDAIDAEFTEH